MGSGLRRQMETIDRVPHGARGGPKWDPHGIGNGAQTGSNFGVRRAYPSCGAFRALVSLAMKHDDLCGKGRLFFEQSKAQELDVHSRW
jgi:hypothetical protein